MLFLSDPNPEVPQNPPGQAAAQGHHPGRSQSPGQGQPAAAGQGAQPAESQRAVLQAAENLILINFCSGDYILSENLPNFKANFLISNYLICLFSSL